MARGQKRTAIARYHPIERSHTFLKGHWIAQTVAIRAAKTLAIKVRHGEPGQTEKILTACTPSHSNQALDPAERGCGKRRRIISPESAIVERKCEECWRVPLVSQESDVDSREHLSQARVLADPRIRIIREGRLSTT